MSSSPSTHFDAFALPVSVQLDVPALETRFRELSLQLHPDRVKSDDPRARVHAAEATTSLNQAYRVLKDPVKRAFYVLKLQGQDLDREDAGANKDLPLELLEEVIELREGLEVLKAKRDLSGAQRMAEQVRAKEQAALAQGQAALEQRLAHPHNSAAALAQATQALARVRYFQRFLEEVERMEEEML